MRAVFDQMAFVHHEDLIATFDRTQTMSTDQHRPFVIAFFLREQRIANLWNRKETDLDGRRSNEDLPNVRSRRPGRMLLRREEEFEVFGRVLERWRRVVSVPLNESMRWRAERDRTLLPERCPPR